MSEATPAKARVAFIDVLRLGALAQMVNGHTLDAVMTNDVRDGAVFHWYGWARGLVSVAFLVASGLAFYAATLMRFEKHRADPNAIRKRFRRGLLLIVIGYTLRLPFALIFGDVQNADQALHLFFRVEVLQCIGVCLLVMEGLTVMLGSVRQVVWACALLSVSAVLLAPLGDAASASGEYLVLTDWLGHHGDSFFPLLPWSGFVFGGVVLGAIVFPQGVATERRVTFVRMGIVVAVAVIAWRLAVWSPWTLRAATTSHHARPELVLQKVALVSVLITILMAATMRIMRLPRSLTILAGETLSIYVFHLIALFGGGWGLAQRFPRDLPLPAALGVSAAMIVASITIGLAWHRYKKWRDGGGWSSAIQAISASRSEREG